ncbi:hypothetical protein XM38_025860 [Halomicronema hongdechloris C2206]|uniref:Uncharacterized protein n=1 Tax=Halomicronema hongdechloris C2206 TaxID=1641165 RepID=A0A1Z3HMU8_9CYAN|nr:hypothetical protein XM38_025860 [Halomicronema hongdechloris C2206]
MPATVPHNGMAKESDCTVTVQADDSQGKKAHPKRFHGRDSHKDLPASHGWGPLKRLGIPRQWSRSPMAMNGRGRSPQDRRYQQERDQQG